MFLNSTDEAIQSFSIPVWLDRLLRLIAVALPIFATLGLYEERFLIFPGGIIASLIALIFFFNIQLYLAIVIPVVFTFANNKLLAAAYSLFIISFITNRIQSGRFEIQVMYPFALITLLLAVANGIGSAEKYGMYNGFFSYLLPVSFLILVGNLNVESKYIRLNLIVLTSVAAALGWLSFLQYLHTGVPRLIIGWGSQNIAASFLGIMISIAILSLIIARDFVARMLWGLGFLGILAGIFVTQTRAVMVGVFFAVMYLALKDRRVLRVVLPAILVGFVAAPTLILFRIKLLLGYGTTPDWSSVGRIEVWLNSLEMLPRVIWFGVGLDSFRWLYPSWFPSAFLQAQHPHNVILRWIFDVGIFGAAALTYIIFRIQSRAFSSVRGVKIINSDFNQGQIIGINAGIICFLIGSMFDAPINSPHIGLLFWTLSAYQLILAKRIEMGRIRSP